MWAPCTKWSLLWCFCLWGGCWILGGLDAVNSEVSSEETHPKSAKECRVHIEKALEEYWDKAQPSPDASSSNRNLLSNSETTDEGSSNKEDSQEPTRNCNDDDTEGKDDGIAEEDKNDESNDEETLTEDNQIADQNITSASLEDNKPVQTESSLNVESEEVRNQNVEKEAQRADTQKVESQVESPKEVDVDLPSNKSVENKAEVRPETTRRVFVVKNLNKETIEFSDLNSDSQRVVETETENKKLDDKDIDEDDDADNTDEDDEDNSEDVVEDVAISKNVSAVDGKDDVTNAEKKESEDVKPVPEASVSDGKTTSTNESVKSEVSSDKSETQANISKVLEGTKLPQPEIQPSVVSIEKASSPATETPVVSNKSETTAKIGKGTAPLMKEELIENIYDEEEDEDEAGLTYRRREHIDAILGLDEVGTEQEKEEEKLAQSIFKDIKRIELSHIRPMELLYKFADSTSRSLGDAEIFTKPMILFLGPWNSGKTTIINYILGIERTPSALETGTGITDVGFTVLTHGPQRRVISGTELVTDWRYSGVQKFGQGFLDHFRGIHIPHALLQKVTIVDTPGILENRKTGDRSYSLNDAFQWFIDRADAIYVVLDPNKVDIGSEVGAVIDQLKGRDVRFVLNKADSIRRSDLMRVVGQLFWNLSPLMSSSEAPVIYAVSLTTHPYHPSAPTRFLDDQEMNLFYDMRSTLDRRVENRILYARKHAVHVRNHAKMVDCYLATFYRHKSIFSNKRNVAKLIVDNPRDYSIYDGLSSMTNVSRYDLPNPVTYKDFFRTHALYDFKPLASTCSYFRGCPMDKLDEAIAKDIPELLARYKRAKMVVQVVPDGNR